MKDRLKSSVGPLLTAEGILEAIRGVARKLRRAPTRAEFTRATGISHFRLQAHFASLREAVRQAGLTPHPQGRRIATVELLRDWAGVARRLGGAPSRSQYLRHGRYSAGVFTLRFGSWTAVPASFVRFARDNELDEEWGDVLRMIEQGRGGSTAVAEARSFLQPDYCRHEMPAPARAEDSDLGFEARRGDATCLQPSSWPSSSSSLTPDSCKIAALLPAPLAGQRRVTATVLAMIVRTLAPQPLEGRYGTENAGGGGRMYSDRPVLGAPLPLGGLVYAPVNEAGVVFLFGMLAHRLGFRVEYLQSAFPDCEAVRETQPGRWQRVRIEFEYESRNFLTHRHPAAECDVIVCWRHNWAECPLDVVELRREIERRESYH
jgi:hypothetical protein